MGGLSRSTLIFHCGRQFQFTLSSIQRAYHSRARGLNISLTVSHRRSKDGNRSAAPFFTAEDLQADPETAVSVLRQQTPRSPQAPGNDASKGASPYCLALIVIEPTSRERTRQIRILRLRPIVRRCSIAMPFRHPLLNFWPASCRLFFVRVGSLIASRQGSWRQYWMISPARKCRSIPYGLPHATYVRAFALSSMLCAWARSQHRWHSPPQDITLLHNRF